MSDASRLDLDELPPDERDLQIAVAGAQRLMHDDILQQFLSEMRKTAEHYAVYGTTPEIRDLNRTKVIAVDELRGYFEKMAMTNIDRQAEEARNRALEDDHV
jgi:hypothetical protein